MRSSTGLLVTFRVKLWKSPRPTPREIPPAGGALGLSDTGNTCRVDRV
jgi:hypothetical protein